MIIIDTDMPKKCMDCQLLGHDKMYCTLYPRKDLDVITVAISKPDWCPIKCDIDDIRQEILEETKCPYGDKCLGANCPSNTDCMIMGEHVILIIDKHIGERREVKHG